MVKKLPNRELVSPDGTKFLYFEDGQYRVYDMAAGASRVITEKAPVSFVDTRGRSQRRSAAGSAGRLGQGRQRRDPLRRLGHVASAGERGRDSREPHGNGRATKVRYQRRVVIDPQERGIDLSKPLYFATYGEWTKKEGLAKVDPSKPGAQPLVWDDAKFAFQKAKDADVCVYTKQTVDRLPELLRRDRGTSSSAPPHEANPQQKDFAWTSGVKLINYTSAQGRQAAGRAVSAGELRAGQEVSDCSSRSTRSARSSRTATSTPNETSTPNRSIYTSRGYAVFDPDIVYRVNDPGMSAVWCVIPAVKAAIATGHGRLGERRPVGPLVGRLPDGVPRHADEHLQVRRSPARRSPTW